mgnify:CR=1 FL=1
MIDASVWFSRWIGDAFLGLDGLVQPVGPAAARHQPAGEFVDDDHLAVLHDVVLVAMEQRVRAQRRVQVMHQRDVVRVVQAACRRASSPAVGQDVLGVLVTLLGQQHLVRLLVDPVVALALLFLLPDELRRELVQPVVELDVVVGLARR